MTMLSVAPALAASWPWGPPGAEWFDVLAVYGLMILLITLIVWNSRAAPTEARKASEKEAAVASQASVKESSGAPPGNAARSASGVPEGGI